jgi:hypothetical protein
MEQFSSLLKLLPFVLFVVIIGLLISKREKYKILHPKKDEDFVSGIGGWLLVLIIMLIINGMLDGMKTYVLWSSYISLHNHPDTQLVQRWYLLFLCCLTFYTVFCMVSRRTLSTVGLTIVTLWAMGPIRASAIFFPPVGILWSAGPTVLIELYTLPQVLSTIIVSCIMPAMWTLYLYKSKRVKATYCANQNSPASNSTQEIASCGDEGEGVSKPD